MIKPQEFKQRREKFIAQLPEKSIAIIMNGTELIRKGDSTYPFTPNGNFYYLTGFIESDAVAVFIPGDNNGEYLLFSQECDPVKEVWHGKRVGQQRAVSDFGAHRAHSITELEKFLQEFASEYKNYTLYYPYLDQGLKNILAKWQINLVTEDANIILAEMRLVKSPAEIAVMQKAADISSQGHRRIMRCCKPGMKEYQLEAEFIYACGLQGARFQAYPPIVATGINACTLHYENNDQLLQSGQLLLIDAGCEYQHYASDITRTYPVNGRFTAEQKAIYEIVLNAQLEVIALIRPGVPFIALQQTAIKVITTRLVKLGLLQGDVDQLIQEKAYFSFYMHNVSHWLGLDTHDVGSYKVANQSRLLQEGNVLTVEPGIYIAADNFQVAEKWRGIGVRIEDDIVVTAEGCRLLSNVPKTVAEIETIMAAVN